MPKVISYRGQDYANIKKNLLKKGELFLDPEFPANGKSLYFSRLDTTTVWKRPQVN